MATADRVLSILGLFTIERLQWSVEDAAAELGWPISTTYRYFRSLSDAGLIVPYMTGRYVLGSAIIQYDRLTRHFDPLITAARPAMVQLAASSGMAAVVMLCRLFRDRVMCVHQEVGGEPDFALSFERGQPMPLVRGACSRAIFANLPPRVARQYCERHAAELAEAGLGSDWTAVRSVLRTARGKVCVSHGELDPAIMGIAVPILDAGQTLVGSLGLVLSAPQATSSLDALVDRVTEAGRRVSAGFLRMQAEDDVKNTGLTDRKPSMSIRQNSRMVRNRAKDPAVC